MILEKLLNKRGITRDQLNTEEKIQYEGWEKILKKEELSTEDLKQFISYQITVIESRWKDLDIEQSKKAELIPYHTVYKLLLAAIDAPRIEREELIRNLEKLI